jgi:hypothetical protein
LSSKTFKQFYFGRKEGIKMADIRDLKIAIMQSTLEIMSSSTKLSNLPLHINDRNKIFTDEYIKIFKQLYQAVEGEEIEINAKDIHM